MKIILTAWMASFFYFSLPSSAFAKTISDSLVTGLPCQALNTASILKSIRTEAFSASHHLPFRNWAFRSGGLDIAACWGMASTQRKLFYLVRLNQSGGPAVDTKSILDMIRGARLEVSYIDQTGQWSERKIKQYNLIPVAEKNLREEYENQGVQSFLGILLQGIDYKIDSFQVHRDFKSEVERSQELHFYRPQNIGMGAGSGALSPRKNKQSLQNLMANLQQNKLTLVNLRQTRTFQHIVIAKSFTKDTQGNVWLNVYDSNQPETDQKIYYSQASGHFYSQEIMISPEALGFFIVDEPEREQLEVSLLKHYQKACL